jgi:cytochrome c
MMRLKMRLTNALAIFGLCVALGIGPTQAQTALGDAKRGQELSQRVCSGCHSVTPGSAATVNADVPTFAGIASRPDLTAERLAGRIIVPHPPMPNVQLTVAEMRDIIAYILSLRQR